MDKLLIEKIYNGSTLIGYSVKDTETNRIVSESIDLQSCLDKIYELMEG